MAERGFQGGQGPAGVSGLEDAGDGGPRVQRGGGRSRVGLGPLAACSLGQLVVLEPGAAPVFHPGGGDVHPFPTSVSDSTVWHGPIR